MRWAGNISRVEKIINIHITLVVNIEGKLGKGCVKLDLNHLDACNISNDLSSFKTFGEILLHF